MSDILNDVLEEIHGEQKFGAKAYINKNDLKVTISYDEIKDPNLVELGVPITDDDYDRWFMNQSDGIANVSVNDLYLTGEASDIYDKALKMCEEIHETKGELLEENGFDDAESMLSNPYSLDDVLEPEVAEEIQQMVREIQDYVVSEEISESVNSFSSYSGAWDSLSSYKDFLEEDSDRLNFTKLNKVITNYCFLNSKNMDEFSDYAKEMDLDFDDLVRSYEGKAEELTKDKLELMVNIIFYYDDYRYGTNYLLLYYDMLNDEERKDLITDNEYVRLADLVDSGFLPKNKEEALLIVEQSGSLIDYFEEELANDKDVVLEAIRNNGWALSYVDESFTDDPKIVLEAVNQNITALQFASERIRALCEGNDTIKALESLILQDQLRSDLSNDLNKGTKKSLKL